MFRKKKENELDIIGLNNMIETSNKILKIGLFMAIIALIVLVTFLIKEWNILKVVKEFIIVISPIFIGLIIAWLFDPLVKFLQSKKIPRIVSCIIVYLLFLGIFFLIFRLLVPTFIDQIKDFVSAIPNTLKDIRTFVNNLFNNFSNSHDINLTTVKTQLYSTIENIGVSITTNLPTTLLNIGKSIVSGGMTFILGLMIGFYMLFDFDKVNKNILAMMPRPWRSNAMELSVRVNESLRSYVQGVFLVMFLVFVTQSIGLTLAGLKAPLIFALFCAITDIIPYFGPYIGAIPAIIVGFTISPIVGIYCIVSVIVVQLLENNFYQPLIMGHTMKLHPVTIMVSLLIFQHFFGIIGMIVATPVVASLKIICTFINEKLNIQEKVIGE